MPPPFILGPSEKPAAFHDTETTNCNLTTASARNGQFNRAKIGDSLSAVMELPGAVGCAIVDLDSGRSLGTAGGSLLNLEVAAAGNTEVVRAKIRTMRELDLNDEIEDILITLGKQYHIIRPLTRTGSAGLFLYVALDKSKACLALARHRVSEIARSLTL